MPQEAAAARMDRDGARSEDVCGIQKKEKREAAVTTEKRMVKTIKQLETKSFNEGMRYVGIVLRQLALLVVWLQGDLLHQKGSGKTPIFLPQAGELP